MLERIAQRINRGALVFEMSPPPPQVIYFAEKFKQIDAIVIEEIQDPLMSNTASEIVRVHHSLDPVAYLTDDSFVPYWVVAFQQLMTQFGVIGGLHMLPRRPMLVMQRLDSIIHNLPGVDELKEVASVRALAIVERKLAEVNSFLTSAEVHFQIMHTVSSAGKPMPSFLRNRRGAQDVNSSSIPSPIHSAVLPTVIDDSKDAHRHIETNITQLPQLTTWKMVITRKTNVILFMSISHILCAALQVASCLKSNMWTKGHLNDPELLGVVQQFLMQCLGLYVTLVPTLRDPHLRDMSWIWALSLTSIVLGLLSIPLYLVVGTAWAPLLSFFSTVTQTLVVMYQVEGMASTLEEVRRSR